MLTRIVTRNSHLQHRSLNTIFDAVDENQQAKKLLFPKPLIKEDDMTPAKVVEYLNKFVIGQEEAKRAIAISFRNRWRRKGLPDKIKKEVTPKNILMQGPTGCGKTELARRLANLTDAPFIRVEATKYTQIGYVGKDVSSIIQDNNSKVAYSNYKRRLDDILKTMEGKLKETIYIQILSSMLGTEHRDTELWNSKMQDLKKGLYNSKIITLLPGTYIPDESLPLSPPYPPKKQMCASVKEIAEILFGTYNEKLRVSAEKIDINKECIKSLEEEGIVFLDEIDKLAVPQGMSMNTKGVSTEGVQRDLLPLIQGTVVNTKYGDVRTDHVLFIASGAFTQAKPTDLIPQLLGRLPVRIQMKAITQPQFVRILKEPQFNLVMQQINLMSRQGLNISFTDDAIDEIAKTAFDINLNTENTGARRLHTLMEKIMEEYSFEAPELKGQQKTIDKQYVETKLKGMGDKIKLSRFLI